MIVPVKYTVMVIGHTLFYMICKQLLLSKIKWTGSMFYELMITSITNLNIVDQLLKYREIKLWFASTASTI